MIKKVDLQAVISEQYGAVYRLACALTKNQTDAADLTQETFLILAKHQDQIREPEKTRCWLFTTLRREFLRRCVKRASHPEVPFCAEEHDCLATRPSALHQIDARFVLLSLAKVEESYRATLELFYVGDLSYKEISTALKIPIGTVMSRLARGKQQLKQILHDDFPRTKSTRDFQKALAGLSAVTADTLSRG